MRGVLSDVRVIEDVDGRLVRWSVVGDPDVPVEVTVGATSDVADHTAIGKLPAGRGEFRLSLGAGRQRFIAVTAAGHRIVAASRQVALGAVLNFRDVGGYPVAGGVTRWGAVYRSDSLHRMTDTELTTFAALGVRAVFDLRSVEERATLPSHPGSIHHPVESRPVVLAATAVRTREQAEAWEVVPTLVEVEVAVPRLTPAVW
ncbi:MAG: tyrosine-protein phosphatase [Acidimicrobiales bacterium]